MIDGFVSLSWWGIILVILGLTHVTIAAVTIYLHRCQAHRALDLHPVVSHFFRFWLWLTTGMVTKEWVAIHRKHHAKCETEEDPHSPHFKGIHTVLWKGAELYREEARNRETLKNHGHGTPNDWWERHVYTPYNFVGVSLLLILNCILFGVYGITIWAVQMMWIPFFAAGVINGLGHYWGYRNFETADGSTNQTNVAVLIGGEELHNNHHAFPSSAKLSVKWWEFDIGWLYIRLFVLMGLAQVRRVAPKPVILNDKVNIDMDTLRAVIISRLHIMAKYAKNVTLPVFKEQLSKADAPYRRLLKQVRIALVREESRIDDLAMNRLQHVLSQSDALQTVYEFRRRLQKLWNRHAYTNHEKLLQGLQEWCQQAEATGVEVLREFAQHLRGYSLQAV